MCIIHKYHDIYICRKHVIVIEYGLIRIFNGSLNIAMALLQVEILCTNQFSTPRIFMDFIETLLGMDIP